MIVTGPTLVSFPRVCHRPLTPPLTPGLSSRSLTNVVETMILSLLRPIHRRRGRRGHLCSLLVEFSSPLCLLFPVPFVTHASAGTAPAPPCRPSPGWRYLVVSTAFAPFPSCARFPPSWRYYYCITVLKAAAVTSAILVGFTPHGKLSALPGSTINTAATPTAAAAANIIDHGGGGGGSTPPRRNNGTGGVVRLYYHRI